MSIAFIETDVSKINPISPAPAIRKPPSPRGAEMKAVTCYGSTYEPGVSLRLIVQTASYMKRMNY